MKTAQGFPAFPPTRRGGAFATTWWGGSWISTLEDTALDLGQLKKGKRLAKAGAVGPITVGPGLLAASVDDGDPHSARMTVRTFDDGTWAQLVGRISERAATLAALLDGVMPRELAESAADLGIDLIPALGDLDSECTCDGWELPCNHAAAVAYQLSWLIDDDPFLLLMLRGRGRDELLTELRAVAPRERTKAPQRPFGTPAVAAYSRFPGPLPRIPDFLPAERRSDESTPVGRIVESAARRARDVLNDRHDATGGPA